MLKLSALLLTALFAPVATIAQTCDLVFFTDDGAKFTLVIDGDVKNAAPASRVVAMGIRNETPLCVVKFEDKSIPDVKQSGWFTMGKESTILITTNKKGQRVFRPQGEAELGTAAKTEAKPKPAEFVDDRPAQLTTKPASTVQQDVQVGGLQQTTTVTVVEEGGGTGTGTGENVNMSIGINGVGINMNVGVTDGTTNQATRTTTTTTRTTTTTTTTGTVMADPVRPAPKPEPVVEQYRMPGYTGPIGCAMPMSGTEFTDAKKSIESKGFEETRLTVAKQIGRDRCFSTDQVKGIMGVFSFEESKLDFAKWAYERTHDKGNYYKVNDAFSFSSSLSASRLSPSM
ncbi:MAG TPA: DUF4476 domain-containing protein [Flavobacteriales bacterium]|nr:DUF4476 domain-containing protein [Flavobacteriales bacterium]